MEKVCFKCNTLQPLTEYYKHAQMADGHLNKCKACTKKDAKERTEINTSTPEGLEKERKRHRDKYSRLGYKELQKEWDKDKPWKQSQVYKNLRRKYKTLAKGFELHHWNYNDELLEDVFIMTNKEHKQLHNHLILNTEQRLFCTHEGVLLDTKEKHESFIESKGFKIHN